MEAIVEEEVSAEDLAKFQAAYETQAKKGHPSSKAQFEYAWCLVRSHKSTNLRRGVVLLEDLYHQVTDETAKRDYLFYMAVGHTRLKEYEKALKFANAILLVEPKNHQAMQLRNHIEKKMKRDGLVGLAIVGGAAAVALGGLVGLGVALSKKS